ncbi:MAG TPA: CYTH domain-containing protein [Solirubrobacteraceae bacterium]|nr:CYTH domain-containing protein [Solirubrobacteraceae bacterium]
MEIERKFLVPDLPADLDQMPSTLIEQGYIVIGADGTEVRVRRRGGDAVLTIKAGAGRTRTEEEFAIDDERFARLWPLTEGRRVEKTRHVMATDGGLEFEIDVYTGGLAGLSVVEVEFASEQAADTFTPPAWFGREVTDDARFKNQRLASDGAP